ncbi:NAD(P)-binding protein [Cylindrobasidium torrendii FP15055 ss-10]|uniref:NAD(P)-binding protein n=1 Tax=Cylindrobasidium torrendii FP15055 ss-10 TaxID=1314674 RepID=A0A0D7BN13_9AGAR|nr:NAD(P)-binding protein [Cylindrobasidium torrendii FP15055 ss-10]
MALPEYIKALVNTNDNGNPGVEVKTLPFARTFKVARLPADHLVVKARAFGLNPTDWKLTIGDWAESAGTGKVVGYDMAGEVVAAGPDVHHLKVGDRIAVCQFGTYYQDNGAFADYSVVDSALGFKLPESVPFEAGAALLVRLKLHRCTSRYLHTSQAGAYTAMQAIHGRLHIPLPSSGEKVNKTIVIWSAASAVGHGAVQLAVNAGLKVIAVASPRNHSNLRELGASACVDYKDADAVAKIKAAAGGRIDFGIDCVGVDNSSDSTVAAMSEGGHLISIMLASSTALALAQSKNIKVEFILGGTLHGFEFNIAALGGQKVPVIPEDYALMKKWTSTEMPYLFERNALKAPKVRVMPGGLHGIANGLKIMREGAYGAEKLVYSAQS